MCVCVCERERETEREREMEGRRELESEESKNEIERTHYPHKSRHFEFGHFKIKVLLSFEASDFFQG